MPQVTIYIPEALESDIREKAKKMKKSLSAYITDLIHRESTKNKWSRKFINLYGSTKGELKDVTDLEPEEVDTL